ncbi:hypothetical protein PENTCL1PPCAC_11734, partial [Pristionchus entomophagus]
PFSSCSNFDAIRDFEYGDCSYNDSIDSCYLIDELQIAQLFGTSAMVIIPKVISCLSLSLNIFYGILSLSWRKKGLSCKKNNVFLASRSYTSVITILLLNIALFVWMYGQLNFFLTSIFLGLIDTADFMFIMGTNFAHSVLLYTAVIHPFIYANYLTFKHCVGVGISLVFLASLQGVVIGMGCSILLFPSSSPIKCPIETCQ